MIGEKNMNPSSTSLTSELLARVVDRFDARSPPTPMGAYFIPGDMEFVAENGRYVGYRVKAIGSLAKLHRKLGLDGPVSDDGFGPVRDFHWLNTVCYRSKICSRCKVSKLTDDFFWQQKGYEGPFKELWKVGRRQSACMECEAPLKAKAHKTRVLKAKVSSRTGYKKSDRTVRIWDPRKMKVIECHAPLVEGDDDALLQLLTNFAAEVILEI